jgi:hypothetical protein
VVVQRHSRCSAFDGYRVMWSPYSGLRCMKCGTFWRTKAGYVDSLPDAKGDESYALAADQTSGES